MNTNIRDFVEYLVLSLCEDKDAVSITESVDDRGNLIIISVAEADMGRLIGRAGKNISALRTLVNVMAARTEQRYSLKVVE
ncbi:RNA-binding protein [bacterium DOLZORAL124_38_8]|nr:MAG: RNA-binding protein [bacterium DOLZORAL124_38_8]